MGIARERTLERGFGGLPIRLGLLGFDPLDFPDDLVFVGGGLQHEIWLGNKLRILYRCESTRAIVIKVRIEVPDRFDVLLGAAIRAGLEGVHADVDVEAFKILEGEPCLKFGARNLLGGRYALDHLAAIAASQQNSNAIRGLKIGTDIVGCRKRVGHRSAPCFAVSSDTSREYCGKVVTVGLGVVTANFEDFRDEPFTWPAF